MSPGHNRRRDILGAAMVASVASLVVPIPPSAGAAGTASAGPDAAITIDIGGPLRMADGERAPKVSPAVVGANARWNDDELGAWDPVRGRPAVGFTRAAKAAELNTVRYPGGTVANFFDFTEAIGAPQQRGCQTSGGFARPTFEPLPAEQNRFGPDEEQKLVASFGGTTMIMVPSINRTARDAADFVEYMNAPADGARSNPNGGVDWAERRAANGHRKPYAIKTWEYGNEPYLAGQRYWRDVDPTTRAEQFVYGGWARQTADSAGYSDNDGLFGGCDLATRQTGSGQPKQTYRTRYRPIALPGDTTAESGPIAEPVLTVAGERWRRVDRLDVAGSDDQVYRVDRRAGTIEFGDGRHGAVPPQGAELAVEYTTGRQDGFLDYQRAMKAVDPKIQVCAGYAKKEFVDAIGSHRYDCLGVHSYTSPAGGDADGPYDTGELYDHLMALSDLPTADLAELRRRLGHYFPDARRRPDLIVTEYGTLNAQNSPDAPLPPNFTATLMHNVYLASLLAGQINNGVRISINSNLNNRAADDLAKRDWGQLLASPPGFLLTGRAQAISLAAGLVGGTPRTVHLSGDGPPGGTEYRSLVTAATCRDGRLAALLVNRSRTEATPVDFIDRSNRARGRISTVTGAELTDFDTDQQNPVRTDRRALPGRGGKIRATLPPHSVNLVELDRWKGCAR